MLPGVNRFRWSLALGLPTALVLFLACGGTGGSSTESGSGTGGSASAGKAGSATAGSATAGASGGTAGGGSFGNNGGGDGGPPDALPDGCATITKAADRPPLHLFVLLDRSGSMATKWDAAKAGLAAFLGDPASTDIDVGFGVFPPVAAAPGGECLVKYEDPIVPFAKLPGNAKPINDKLATIDPNGFGTPVYVALSGGLERGIQTLKASPKDRFVVLLVTDGEPEGPPTTCNGQSALDVGVIGSLAENGWKTFGVRTFVVGLPGVSPSFAQTVAQKGGGQAVLLDSSVDVAQKFQAALSTVLGEGLGCEFPLPPQDPTPYSYDEVNVRFTDGKGGVKDVARSVGCKDPDAWDYDGSPPTKIVLCGDLCKKAKGDGLAKVDAVLGCPTIVK